MNKLWMILVFLLKLLFIKFGSALPNTIRIGKYFSIIKWDGMMEYVSTLFNTKSQCNALPCLTIVFIHLYYVFNGFEQSKWYYLGGLFDATDSGKDGGYVSEETAFRLCIKLFVLTPF